MSGTGLKGYPCSMGGKVAKVGYINGPVSYVGGVTGGLPILDTAFRSLDYVSAGITRSGLYQVEAQPITIGNGKQWRLRFFNTTTAGTGLGAEPANGANLSAEIVQFLIIGG